MTSPTYSTHVLDSIYEKKIDFLNLSQGMTPLIYDGWDTVGFRKTNRQPNRVGALIWGLENG